MKEKIIAISVLLLLITMIFSGCIDQNIENKDVDLEEAYNTYRPAYLNVLTEGRVFDFSSIVESDGSVKNTTTVSYQIRVINNDAKAAEDFCISLADINDDLKIWAFEIGVQQENMKMKLLFTDGGFLKTGDAYFGDILSNGTLVASLYVTMFETEPGSFNDNRSYNMRIILAQEYPSPTKLGEIILKTKTEIISYKVRT